MSVSINNVLLEHRTFRFVLCVVAITSQWQRKAVSTETTDTISLLCTPGQGRKSRAFAFWLAESMQIPGVLQKMLAGLCY